jgi:SAM-dependent methyltransferase
MDVRGQMDRIYGGMAPEDIPWNRREPPDLLVQLVDSQLVSPCDAVDLGCGFGHYATWLASRGFRVTGLDISATAIEQARRHAADVGVSCRFVVADLTREVPEFDDRFDFAYDWEVLHHVFPEERQQYVNNVHRMLRPGGRYLSVCFSEEDPAFGGEGKVRETPLGTTLYFSSENELRDLFSASFDVETLGVVEIAGTPRLHRAVRAFMRKPGDDGHPIPSHRRPY